MSGKAIATAVKASVGRAARESGAALKYAGGAEIFSSHRSSMMFNGVKPFKTNDTFIAPSATVVGNVTNWDESSVWYGAVVRGDSHPISIGFCSNVQDRAVIHTVSAKKEILDTGFPPVCNIGHFVSVGAGSVLVSCQIDDYVNIGEKCTIMEGAVVQSHSILEPGSVVPAGGLIPSGQRWGGNPIKFIETLGGEAKEGIKAKAVETQKQAAEHLLEFLPYGTSYVQLEDLEKAGKNTQSV